MPRCGRRRRQSADWLDEYLCTGRKPPRGTEGYNPFHFLSDSDALPHWLERRDEILPRFVERYPDRRPWAWWLFDSGLRRVPRDEVAALAKLERGTK